jgi:hypothetical protein
MPAWRGSAVTAAPPRLGGALCVGAKSVKERNALSPYERNHKGCGYQILKTRIQQFVLSDSLSVPVLPNRLSIMCENLLIELKYSKETRPHAMKRRASIMSLKSFSRKLIIKPNTEVQTTARNIM